jgi:hypothetical protein
MGNLTVKQIELAKAKEKPYKLMDGDGLQLRIATDGAKSWLVRYMFDGKERQYRIPDVRLRRRKTRCMDSIGTKAA